MTPSISRTDLAAQRLIDEVLARAQALSALSPNDPARWPGYTPWAQAYESVTGSAARPASLDNVHGDEWTRRLRAEHQARQTPGIDRLARAVYDPDSQPAGTPFDPDAYPQP